MVLFSGMNPKRRGSGVGVRSWRIFILSVVLLGAATVCSARSDSSAAAVPRPDSQDDKRDQNYYANAHPYLEEPLPQLIERIPELKTIQPALDQQELHAILENTGKQVDQFFINVIDLTAHEQITEENLDAKKHVKKRLQAEDSYLFLRRGPEIWGTVGEYRVDANGNPMDEVGRNKGFFDTSNFALDHVYFATAHQPESRFLYLGRQKIGTQDTYVVAFAQNPGHASLTMAMEGERGDKHYVAHLLVQGIAWIDANSFQIVRLRTDLLAPRQEIHLNSVTTTVTFGEVHIPDVATSLWLPSEVQVYGEFTGLAPGVADNTLIFRNDHRYTDYQRYRVSVKMLTDSVGATPPHYVLPLIESTQNYYANVHPYLDEPLKKLRGQIPELNNVRPAADQQALPAILEKSARNVDDFFHHIVDLTALEEVTQSRLNDMDVVTASERVKDNYLLLFHGGEVRTDLEEYRMDAKGNRLGPVGLDKGYIVTFGFALICNYFSSALQPESKFRYLGDQKLDSRDTYVVAFAQQPGVATLFTTLTGAKGRRVNMLMQGIAWIDKSNLQIVRVRTDLLAPHPEVGLNRQTTEVTFSKVQLLDVAVPLWLPNKVKVYLEYRLFDPDAGPYERRYMNEHRYSDYRRYRVAVKMLVPK